jgi:glutamate racemase
MTLRQEKFAALLEHYRSQAEIIPVPASELVEYVERGELDGPALLSLVKHILDRHMEAPADALVLGCTHFPFVRPVIEQAAPHTVIYDGGNGTAREARRQLSVSGLINPASAPGSIEIQNSSGDPDKIMLCYQLLDA